MTVRELNQEQLDELKVKAFYLDIEEEDEFSQYQESWNDDIQLEWEKAQLPYDISNETIYTLFEHYSFVKEDFWCNLTDDELPKSEVFDLADLEPYADHDELQDIIVDMLSNKYGYCVNKYQYKIVDNRVYITEIEWDTEE